MLCVLAQGPVLVRASAVLLVIIVFIFKVLGLIISVRVQLLLPGFRCLGLFL